MLLGPGFFQTNKTYLKGAAADFILMLIYLNETWPINTSTMTYGFFRTVFDANGNILADYG